MSFSTEPAKAPFPLLPLPELDSIIAAANLGFDVRVCSNPWADSSVAEFWQCRSVSSRMTSIGVALLMVSDHAYCAG